MVPIAEHTPSARSIGRRRDNAAVDIFAQSREPEAAIRRFDGFVDRPAANHDRVSTQLRVTKALDRRIVGVHAQVRDAARRGHYALDVRHAGAECNRRFVA